MIYKGKAAQVPTITITLTKDQAYRIVELLVKRDVTQQTYAFNWRIVEKLNKALLEAYPLSPRIS